MFLLADKNLSLGWLDPFPGQAHIDLHTQVEVPLLMASISKFGRPPFTHTNSQNPSFSESFFRYSFTTRIVYCNTFQVSPILFSGRSSPTVHSKPRTPKVSFAEPPRPVRNIFIHISILSLMLRRSGSICVTHKACSPGHQLLSQ